MIYVSHLLPDSEMKEIIELTGAGVESIDFAISDNLDQLGKSINAYRKRLKEIGCRNLAIHGPYMDINPAAFDSQVRKATLERFAQTYTAAQELGAERVVFHSGMNPYIYMLECWADRVSAFFQEFLQDKTEIEIVMENVFDPKWQPVLDVYRQVNAPNFHLCLDMGHAHCYSDIPVTEWAKRLSPYVTHVHLHDNKGDRDAHMGLGEGNLPYREVLALLPCTEGRTWTIECNSREAVLQSFGALISGNILDKKISVY